MLLDPLQPMLCLINVMYSSNSVKVANTKQAYLVYLNSMRTILAGKDVNDPRYYTYVKKNIVHIHNN